MILNSLAKDKNSDRFTIFRSKLRTESFQSVLHISLGDSKDNSFPFIPRKYRFDSGSSDCKSSPSWIATLLSERKVKFLQKKNGDMFFNAMQSFRIKYSNWRVPCKKVRLDTNWPLKFKQLSPWDKRRLLQIAWAVDCVSLNRCFLTSI